MRDRTEYIVRLRPTGSVNGITALRAVLKKLLRRHGLKAVSIQPVNASDPDTGRGGAKTGRSAR